MVITDPPKADSPFSPSGRAVGTPKLRKLTTFLFLPKLVCGGVTLCGWWSRWPEVVVAPPVHVHVLVVQITPLLFAVVARVVLSVVWVEARVAPLHGLR